MNNFQRDVQQFFFDKRFQSDRSEEIREYAFRLYRALKLKFRKRENHLALVFFCLWCAHKHYREPIDPHDLAEYLCLPPSMITKSLKTFAEHRTGYRMPRYTFTEHDFIDYYNKELRFPIAVVDELKRTASRLMEKHPSLGIISPQTIAGAVFIHHCKRHKIKENIMKMIHKKSSVLIHRIVKKIDQLE